MPETADVQALFQHGFALHQKGALDEAEKIYRQVLAQRPEHFDALHLLGVIALQFKNFPQAAALIEKAIAANPGHPSLADAYINRGAALRSLQRSEDAVVSYDRAITLKPDNAAAHYNRAVAVHVMGRRDAAVAGYDAALTLQPNDIDALYGRGMALLELKQPEAALASFDAIIRINTDLEALHRLRGDALSALKDYDAAIESYDRAIRQNPQDAEAHYNRALALGALQQHQAAIAAFNNAITLQPENDKAYTHRGIFLAELSRHAPALASFDKAIALNPNAAQALQGRGNALANLKRYEEAIGSYDKAFALNPLQAYLQGSRLYTRMVVCDWRDFSTEIADIHSRMERGEKVAPPFANLSLTGSPRLQRKAMDIYKSRLSAISLLSAHTEARHVPGRKIRVGYFSMDFRDHAVGFLLANLIETHDRERFEIHGFSFGPGAQDETRKRLENAFDVFTDVAADSDATVVERARAQGIDIAVDLAGYTGGCRPGIFARPAAPVQVNYLGYPGTTGLDAMDYIIADWTVIPSGDECHYSEKIARLPVSYQPSDSKLEIAEKTFTRDELGLPPTGFVYCCFNNNYKITPDIFDAWMRILKTVEGSVLWLLEDSPASALNLRTEAERRGVAGERLIFAKRIPRADHLARHRAADVFLDTLPYNAHTTASDALWTGLPVLTRMGEAFASRVAASLLRAVGLPEMITTAQEDYEALAIALANDRDQLARIRQKLADVRPATPLFNIAQYTKDIEALYTRMVHLHRAGRQPEHMDTGAPITGRPLI